MRRPIILLALGIAACSFGQTRSSFLGVDLISGINVTVSNAGLSFLVSVDNSPSFTYQNHVYQITKVFGFYALSDDDDLTVTNSDFSANFGPWNTNNSNSGTGGIAGWKSNPNNGITPGGSESFTFSSLNTANVERLGYHVMLNENFPGTSGNTGNITTVPEPASMVALVGALFATATKRFKKRSN